MFQDSPYSPNLCKAELWERNQLNATQTINFSHAGAGTISLNTRRVLGLGPAAAIPHGYAATIQIDLDNVAENIRGEI
jgi:hypothetical protein